VAGLPETFCNRSELRKVDRAKYSPTSGGMVRVMDHDCVWVGTCIGGGNHRAFVSMLLSGEASLLLCAHSLALHVHTRGRALRLLALALGAPLSTAAPVVHARLLLLVITLCGLLLVVLTPLLISQLWLIGVNMTTVELLRGLRQQRADDMNSGGPAPCCRPPLWFAPAKEVAPHNRGVLRNVFDFVTARRDPARVAASVMPASGGLGRDL
tara:strand:- start:273 stop:905 length:633 start_codon:yes stop_codon:yes gene_type:complete